MKTLRDFFKRELPPEIKDDIILEEEVVEDVTVVEDVVDDKQYAIIHISAAIDCINKTKSPMNNRIIRDLENILELL